jgi:hypothetical protein
MVLSQDVAGLSEEFLVARDAMGEFVDEAWRQSEEILSQLKLG